MKFRKRKQKWTENAQARRERNRKSARESRLRKKNFVQSLEEKVFSLSYIQAHSQFRSSNLKLKSRGNA